MLTFRQSRRVLALASAAAVAGSLLAFGANAASTQIAVGELGVVSGTATGQISGFAPNAQVTVDGKIFQADTGGVVTLNAAPLDGDGKLTVEFVDSSGTPQTATVDLTDALTGLPLTLGQILDPIANTTSPVALSVGESSSGGSGGTGGAGGPGGSGGAGASGSTPAGAVVTAAGVSIPASSVTTPARFVIDRVSFTPMTLRTRRPFAARIRVKDTRGYLVRDAIVYVAGVPARRLRPAAEARTNAQGIATFTLRPTKLLPLKKGALLTMFVRARKQGEPVLGGVSTRRLVSLRLSSPRRSGV